MPTKRLNFILLLIAVLAIFLISCEDKTPQNKPIIEENETIKGGENMITKNISLAVEEQLAPPIQGEDIAIMKTNKGDMKIKFFPNEAPKTVENFLTHSKNGYYDGLTFHRVINDFMVQTGDPTATGSGGESIWGENFEDEFSLKRNHFRGALSMANPNMPNSNSSQFFIVQAKKVPQNFLNIINHGELKPIAQKYSQVGGTPHLDFLVARPQSNGHSVFAQVYEGMEVLDNIASVKVDTNDKPLEDVIIKSIEITVAD